MINITKDIKEQSISATIIRANGSIEELGVISFWNKNIFKRIIWNIKNKIKGVKKWFLEIQNLGLGSLTSAWHASSTRPLYLQWGSGTGATAANTTVNSTASTEESRVTGTSSQQTVTITNDTYQVTGTITANNSRSITELGVFDAAGTGNPPTGGNMLIYGDFGTITLANADSIAFTLKTTFS